jgi:hypothetical protein
VPGSTPTPYPKCSEMGGVGCGWVGGCPPGEIVIGRASDCDYCCKKVTPTPTPVPFQCGDACIPSFIVEGGQYRMPQYSQHRIVVWKILPSGWLRIWDTECGNNEQCWYWVNLKLTSPIFVLEPVLLHSLQD